MHERDLYAALRADRELIDRAAAHLRHVAAQDEYRGRRHPEFAYGLASVLDKIALGLTDLPPAIRTAVVDTARRLLAASAREDG